MLPPRLSAAVAAGALAAAAADYVVVPADRSDASAPADIAKVVLAGAGGGPANGYLANVSNGPPHFQVWGPVGGDPCGKRAKTSATAKARNCRWATNGGPFNVKDGACDEGVFIVNGSTLGTGGWGGAYFGVTADGRWVMGQLDANTSAALNVTWAIPGFGWLVRGGVNVASNASTFKAPRTTIGTTARGQLLVLEVDGCEPEPPSNCGRPYGLTEYMMAELLVRQGAHHAINLDGGGSSATAENGKLISHPTNTDKWLFKSERAVATITCIV